MKKNMLKYCLILLMTLLFCAEAMSKNYEIPICGGSETHSFTTEKPFGYDDVVYTVHDDNCTDDDPETPCCAIEYDGELEECIGQGLGCRAIYFGTSFPLGNGAILLSLLVMGYGVFLYYRRKPLRV